MTDIKDRARLIALASDASSSRVVSLLPRGLQLPVCITLLARGSLLADDETLEDGAIIAAVHALPGNQPALVQRLVDVLSRALAAMPASCTSWAEYGERCDAMAGSIASPLQDVVYAVMGVAPCVCMFRQNANLLQRVASIRCVRADVLSHRAMWPNDALNAHLHVGAVAADLLRPENRGAAMRALRVMLLDALRFAVETAELFPTAGTVLPVMERWGCVVTVVMACAYISLLWDNPAVFDGPEAAITLSADEVEGILACELPSTQVAAAQQHLARLRDKSGDPAVIDLLAALHDRMELQLQHNGSV